MVVSDKSCVPMPYRCRRAVAVSIVALLGLAPSARAAIPSVDPPQPAAIVSASIADGFGTALNLAELAQASGNVGWLLTVAETNLLTSLIVALDDPEMAMRAHEQGVQAAGRSEDLGAPGPQLAAVTNDPATLRQMLGSNESSRPAVLDVATARSQLAALDSYSQMTGLPTRVLQSQSAAGGFDTSMRYLCADKIYSDLYPNGTGWNNHAYSKCGAQGAADPDLPSTLLKAIVVRAGQPPGDPGGGSALIPCGGSIANVSSMTIGSLGNAATRINAAGATASLASFAPRFPFGGGRRQ